MSDRILRENIYVIGNSSISLTGSKLPSCKEVLKVLFFYLRNVKLNLRESAKLVVEELLIFWGKARLPTKEKQHCITKLENLYKEWRNLWKSSGRTSEFHKNKVMVWTNNLDNIFDVAHAEALQMISIEEDKAFLICQRQEGRPGYMYGIDHTEVRRERQTEIREQNMLKRQDRSNREKNLLDARVYFMSTSSESDTSVEINYDNDTDSESPENNNEVFEIPAKKSRGKKNIITPKLAVALDYCKISDRNAVHLISAVLEALGHDIADFILNKTSIHVSRENIRKERVVELKDKFKMNKLNATCLHWDGKILPALTGNEKVDRLPIIISNGEIEQLLEVPVLQSGSGREQADAVYRTICEWGLQSDIKCMVFDTTAVNTGRHKGTCVLIEQILERKLLWLPCRHHIYEIVLRSVFEEKFNNHSSPNVVLFEKFKNAWPKLNVNNWQPGIKDEVVHNNVKDSKTRVINYVNKILNEKQPREDYKEFLELVLLFLGEQLKKRQNSVMVRSPGAFHHARWMGKAIYSLKLYLFREEFGLTASECNGLRQICLFIVNVYVEAWFSAPLAIRAPSTDFIFLSKLEDFSSIDAGISQVAINKFKKHLWYLNPEAIGFAFFDENVENSTKEKMVDALNEDKLYANNMNRAIIEDETVLNFISGGLEQFVSTQTKNFFERFEIKTDFLTLTPSKWPTHDSYISAMTILKHIRVVNDTAERGVKLMEDYNKLLTKNESQKQFVLQVVSDYRRRFPDSKKDTLSQIL